MSRGRSDRKRTVTIVLTKGAFNLVRARAAAIGMQPDAFVNLILADWVERDAPALSSADGAYRERNSHLLHAAKVDTMQTMVGKIEEHNESYYREMGIILRRFERQKLGSIKHLGLEKNGTSAVDAMGPAL